MILTGAIIAGVIAAYAAIAGVEAYRLGIAFSQAVLYAPFKFIWQIDDRGIRTASQAEAPVIYVVAHQSKIDPAMMLALLPENTLHILDDYSASAAWLEPFRNLARTIVFNAEHVFVSRRLVRQLKGNGRLAVYFPDEIEPSAKGFRLYRAVAQIASKADAKIVPIVIGGARHLPFSNTPASKAPRCMFPRLRITVLPPMTLNELAEGAERGRTTAANALFDRLAEARVAAAMNGQSLFQAMRDAAIDLWPGQCDHRGCGERRPHLSRAVRRRPHPRAALRRFERAGRSGRPAAAQFQRRCHVADRAAVQRPRRGDDQLLRRAGQCGGRHPHGGRTHHRFVAGVHREGRARRYRRGRGKSRREIRMAGRRPRRHLPA